MGNKMQKAREAFLEMWSDVLADREGNKELLDWLEHSGFFTAPASASTTWRMRAGCASTQ